MRYNAQVMANLTPEPQRPRRGRPKGRFRYSKRVVKAAGATRALRASIEVYKDDVAGVGERLAPGLAAGEVLPDHALSLQLVGRSVERQLERLRARERHYLETQTRCAATRRESDELARGEVYGKVKSVRQLIDAQFGKERGFEIHRMKGKTLRKPRRLHAQATFLVEALQYQGSPLPEPLLAGLKADRDDWLGMIEPGFERLGDLLDELLHRELEVVQAREERNKALEAFDAAHGEALRLVQATLAFAGCSPGMLKSLRSYVERRRLARLAREKRRARAGGRLQQARAALATAKTSLLGWLGRRVA